jgi:hypothetical protein
MLRLYPVLGAPPAMALLWLICCHPTGAVQRIRRSFAESASITKAIARKEVSVHRDGL